MKPVTRRAVPSGGSAAVALATSGDITSQGFKGMRHAIPAGKLGMQLKGSWILAQWINEQPVQDASKKAAQQINALHGL